MPEEMVLQLSHKDVNLGFFIPRKTEILALQAGMELHFENNQLYAPSTNRPVVLLSRKMQEELLRWSEQGYRVASASVRFIVAWKSQDMPRSEAAHAVLLPDLTLQKTEG